jgi:two-component system cell cycle response regulator
MSTSPKEERNAWDDDVQHALTEVRRLIENVVRREQHRSDLTGLPNDRALDRKIDEALERGVDFWCAFVEVDHFKRLNKGYGLEGGDAMLVKIGQALQFSLDRYFVSPTTAFHAHGDEFYLLGDGPVDSTVVARALEAVRNSIAAITLRFDRVPQPMMATVTIGWATPADLPETSRKLFKKALEDALSVGKRKGRDQTIRYSKEMSAETLYSDRDTCGKCEAAFTVDVDLAKLAEAPFWWCPNCGTKQKRPELEPPSSKPVQLDA